MKRVKHPFGKTCLLIIDFFIPVEPEQMLLLNVTKSNNFDLLESSQRGILKQKKSNQGIYVKIIYL